jgi:hypothetical protein
MKQLNAYCHSTETIESCSEPIECCEISFQASPIALRELAAFLLRCADKLDKNTEQSVDHFHLRDEWADWQEDFTDVIVFPPVVGQLNASKLA